MHCAHTFTSHRLNYDSRPIVVCDVLVFKKKILCGVIRFFNLVLILSVPVSILYCLSLWRINVGLRINICRHMHSHIAVCIPIYLHQPDVLLCIIWLDVPRIQSADVRLFTVDIAAAKVVSIGLWFGADIQALRLRPDMHIHCVSKNSSPFLFSL